MDWPESLPLPQTNLSGLVLNSVIRTQLESGRSRVRNRFGTIIKQFQATWVFLAEEFADFEDFFNDDLEGGVLYFNLNLPEVSSGLGPVSVRFIDGKYSKRYLDVNQWEVTATLEKEVEQSIPDNYGSPLPNWYQVPVDVYESITITAEDSNKLFRVHPSDAETLILLQDTGVDLTAQIIGIQLMEPGGVLVTNVATNLPPLGVTQLITVTKNVAYNGNVTTTDPNSDVIAYAAGTTAPAHGVLSAVGSSTGDYTYTPTTGYTGPDSFTIQASDGNGGITQLLIVANVVPPVETWQDIALELGAWGLYQSAGITTGTGGVTGWNDSSGNAHHLVDNAYSTAKRAALTSGKVQCIRSTDRSANFTLAAGGQSLAQVMVVAHITVDTKPSTSNSSWLMGIYQAGTTSGANQTCVTVNTNGSGNSQFSYAVNSGGGSGSTISAVPLITNGLKGVYTLMQRTASTPTRQLHQMWQNGMVRGASSSTPANCNIFSFGSRADKAFFTLDCTIAGFVVFDNPDQFEDPQKHARLQQMIYLMKSTL